jgi:hypothetical protein
MSIKVGYTDDILSVIMEKECDAEGNKIAANVNILPLNEAIGGSIAHDKVFITGSGDSTAAGVNSVSISADNITGVLVQNETKFIKGDDYAMQSANLAIGHNFGTAHSAGLITKAEVETRNKFGDHVGMGISTQGTTISVGAQTGNERFNISGSVATNGSIKGESTFKIPRKDGNFKLGL